ncbi:sodium:solute symporter [Streptomyces sp. JJ36]|uniref:sodium:solute symporter family protein n=1 Tax=Streptomyces sp. JJ36 TaxID=2736645 RepID=UPI001F1D124B|nr:sodium:solute symporter [Streptomyces sp. JJ36]MCF6521807.1 sodium:solute symporter [Streptomyces sp. JJ36]
MADGAMIAASVAVVGGASLLAVTARGFKRKDNLPCLEGWALADRSLGTTWTWLLLGGTVFTAYTFTAVPGLAYGTGASAFFALPYTVLVCPLAFVLLPRLWDVCRRHGYVTLGDFVRGRYGSGSLALVVALTGILATMPYLALQLLGIRAVLTAGGLYPGGVTGHTVMIVLFAGLALSTYHHGLRTPTVISALKGVVIFSSVLAAVVFVLVQLGGPGRMFADATDRLVELGGSASLSLEPAQHGAYATLAVGSALALFMYPHVSTAALAADSRDTLRRVSVMLPAWTAVLGLFALLGIAALAVGIRTPAGNAEAAVPLLVHDLMPAALAGLVFGALTLGALVPAAVMSIAAATVFVRNVYVEYFDPTATPKRQVRIAQLVSLTAKAGAIAFVFGLQNQAAINLQFLGGVWILQIFPAVVVGLYTPWLHPRALLAGWAVGMCAGTAMVVGAGYSSIVPFEVGGRHLEVYAGLAAVLLNFLVSTALSAIFDFSGVPRGTDATTLPSGLNIKHRLRGANRS